MSPWRNNRGSPRSLRQASSRISWASKKYRSLNSRIPSCTGSNTGPVAAIGPSYRFGSDESLPLRLRHNETPQLVAESFARVPVAVLVAQDRNRGDRGRLAVRENLEGRPRGQVSQGLLRLDERVRAEQSARVERALLPRQGILFDDVGRGHGPSQMNVTTPPSFAAGSASFRNPIMSSSLTPGSTVSGVIPWFLRISLEAAQAQTSAPYLIASRRT